MMRTSMSVLEMGQMLGLHKTDSYYLVKKGYFKTIRANGVLRVMIDSFEDWYAHQLTYRKMDGTEPGQALEGMFLTMEDIQNILGISRGAAEQVIARNSMEKVFIYGKLCVRKECFDAWYAGQTHYLSEADREKLEGKKEVEKMLSPSDIAGLLGVSADTIYRLIKTKNCFEISMRGTRIMISPESFENWYSSQNHYKKTNKNTEELTGIERS